MQITLIYKELTTEHRVSSLDDTDGNKFRDLTCDPCILNNINNRADVFVGFGTLLSEAALRSSTNLDSFLIQPLDEFFGRRLLLGRMTALPSSPPLFPRAKCFLHTLFH